MRHQSTLIRSYKQMQDQKVQKVQDHLLSCDANITLCCPIHHKPYYYVCNSPQCGQLVCGKIECLDSHFHSNSLFISKIDMSTIIHNFKHFQSVLGKLQGHKSSVEGIQSEINLLKQSNNNIFQKRKKIQHIYENLVGEYNLPLNNRFFQNLEQIHNISKQLETEVEHLSGRINWNRIWITLNSETEIIPKLKLQFEQFRYLNLIKRQLLYQQFEKRWQQVDNADFQHEGIISLIFTQENLVIGQFIANSNVQTAKLFLNSFIFIVDREGNLSKSLISYNLLQMTATVIQNQTVGLLTFAKGTQTFQEMKIKAQVRDGLRVTRIQSFLATAH